MQPQDELEQLLARQEALNQELKARKKNYWKPSVSGKKPSNARSSAPNPASPPPNASAAPAA